jgi:hypothetical protein
VKKTRKYIREHRQKFSYGLVLGFLLSGLLLYRLSSITSGISPAEVLTASSPLGWHGLYQHAFYFPINAVRSVLFFLFGHTNAFIVRLPNVPFGGIAILALGSVIWAWYGRRTALLATAMFATSAWTLHVSRLATNDVMYLLALPVILSLHVLLQRKDSRPVLLYLALMSWSLLALVPGLIWLVLVEVFWQRTVIRNGWRHFRKWWQRILYVVVSLWWLPLVLHTIHGLGDLKIWLGLPSSFGSPLHILKLLAAVPVHIFIRGPQYPQLWLTRAPLLDIFTLVCAVIGLYFYATHFRAQRTRLLLTLGVLSILLVGLGGAVSFSLIVPLVYVFVATGIAYLMQPWLRIFPYNPLARGLGIGLITLAVALSCIYNLRAYFVAWPHNKTTPTIFRYHP